MSPSMASGWRAGRVDPTIEVPFDLRYAAGADPQLDRAVEVLTQKLSQ